MTDHDPEHSQHGDRHDEHVGYQATARNRSDGALDAPDLALEPALQPQARRGVEWVRPTELAGRIGGQGLAAGYQAGQRLGSPLRRLAPLASFGRSTRRTGTVGIAL